MSTYYTPKRTKNLYDPASAKPFREIASPAMRKARGGIAMMAKIELYMQCPRCLLLTF
jgi:hypothetical protein